MINPNKSKGTNILSLQFEIDCFTINKQKYTNSIFPKIQSPLKRKSSKLLHAENAIKYF